MSDEKQTMHEQWIEIIKYVALFVAPFVAAVWKITDKWGEIQKNRLTESLKDAVKDVVNPQFTAMNQKMDELSKKQEKDKEELTRKLDMQNTEMNRQIVQIIRDQKK